MSLKVEIVVDDERDIPAYKHEGDAGVDLRMSHKYDRPLAVFPRETKLIYTGVRMSIPSGYELQVRSRSGLALKGIFVANSPGTVDSGYTAEIGVILRNESSDIFWVNPGDRIAQGVVNKIERVEFVKADELEKTDRGEGGFGSTGVK